MAPPSPVLPTFRGPAAASSLLPHLGILQATEAIARRLHASGLPSCAKRTRWPLPAWPRICSAKALDC